MQNLSYRSCAVLAYLVAVDGLSLGRTSESQRSVAPKEEGPPAETTPSDVRSWDGLDDSEGEYMSKDLQPDAGRLNRSISWKPVDKRNAKVFVLLGPMDSGTHLIQKLITSNFAGLMSSHRPKGEIWKHSNDGANNIYKELSKNLQRQTLEETSAIMIIRSPLSQIVSWKNNSYKMRACVDRPYERMNESCQPLLSACSPDPNALHGRVSFRSTVDVYNQYVRQYQQIAADGKFMSAHIFSYEDVVSSTEKVILVLAKLFGKPVPDVIDLRDQSAKGKYGIGRMQARYKIENRLYLNGVSTAQQAILCQGLDYNLADMIVEGSYFAKGDPKRKTHSYDCRAHNPR